MRVLALFSASCYHKMAVKETTPSLAILSRHQRALGADNRPSIVKTPTWRLYLDVSQNKKRLQFRIGRKKDEKMKQR